jgi:hypothetical protein
VTIEPGFVSTATGVVAENGGTPTIALYMSAPSA